MNDWKNTEESCCQTNAATPGHLVIIGGGSAAFAATTRAAERGWRVTIINAGLPIGCTCVNVGCVPSKALIRAAEAMHRTNTHGFAGIESTGEVDNFEALSHQTSGLVQSLRQEKYLDVVKDFPGVEIIEGTARFVGPREIAVGERRIQADRVLIATGTRTHVPDIPGLAEADYLITDTAFALREAPRSLLVLGGRYIALECAQMFARRGVEVTVLQRSARILPPESPELTDQLTQCLRSEGMEIHTGVTTKRVDNVSEGVRIEAEIDGVAQRFVAERLLLATGRTPNTEGLDLEAAGVKLAKDGFIEVEDFLRTSAADVFAAGDVVGEPMFVYTAAYEGALAAANACAVNATDTTKRDYNPLPWVVFTDPQVAGVGLDERQAKAAGIDAESITLPMDKVPRALIARQTDGFLQLIRDRKTDQIIGGRALAHEGSELMMEISLAIRHRMTAKELAALFHPYLTLSEAVKLAALSFGKDVNKLSCCAT